MPTGPPSRPPPGVMDPSLRLDACALGPIYLSVGIAKAARWRQPSSGWFAQAGTHLREYPSMLTTPTPVPSTETRNMPWDADALVFPPWGRGLRLPSAPRRAISNGLGLFDAHNPWRSAAVSVTRSLVRAGAGRGWQWIGVRDRMDPEWWMAMCTSVAEPVVGPVGCAALARRSDRFDVLLMDRDGIPIAFLKFGGSVGSEERARTELEVLEHLAGEPLRTFHVPQVLATGSFEGQAYRLFEPLPDGVHTRPVPDASRIASVVDEFRLRLAGLDRPSTVPAHYVPGHGDFTPRNLRLTPDEDLWLFDWEYCRWMPPLADELRYWTSHHAFRIAQRPQASARRIVGILRDRGTGDDIREAVAWPEFNRPAEEAIRRAVGQLVDRSP